MPRRIVTSSLRARSTARAVVCRSVREQRATRDKDPRGCGGGGRARRREVTRWAPVEYAGALGELQSSESTGRLACWRSQLRCEVHLMSITAAGRRRRRTDGHAERAVAGCRAKMRRPADGSACAKLIVTSPQRDVRPAEAGASRSSPNARCGAARAHPGTAGRVSGCPRARHRAGASTARWW